MKKYHFKEDDVINLNVGGVHFSTTVSTLQSFPKLTEEQQQSLCVVNDIPTDENNMLSAIVSGNFMVMRDEKKRIFIDRNGTYFGYILDYLREQGDILRVSIPFHDKQLVEKLCIECDYYCLKRMKHLLKHGGKFEWNYPQIPSWITKHQWNTLQTWIQNSEAKKNISKQLYQATRDGFTFDAFEERCFKKGSILTIIKSNQGNIFGAYISEASNDVDGMVLH